MPKLINKTKISQWGNSKATRIPNQFIEQLGLKENQSMNVCVKGNSIVLTPEMKIPKDIHELFAGWQDDGQRDTELDWGKPEGNEFKW